MSKKGFTHTLILASRFYCRRRASDIKSSDFLCLSRRRHQRPLPGAVQSERSEHPVCQELALGFNNLYCFLKKVINRMFSICVVARSNFFEKRKAIMPKLVSGFTLVELLVVMSILSILSSIVFSTFSAARARGNDARKLVDAHEVKTALTAYNLDHETMPANYICFGSSCSPEDVGNKRVGVAIEGTDGAYEATMRELVAGGYLSEIPHSPGGAPYAYFNYGNGPVGAVFITTLQTSGGGSSSVSSNACTPWKLQEKVSLYLGGKGGYSYKCFITDPNNKTTLLLTECPDQPCAATIPSSCGPFIRNCPPVVVDYCSCNPY